MDKDEDLKKGKDKEHPITPPSLAEPDGNKGHSKNHMGEEDEPDPTDDDAPESEINKE